MLSVALSESLSGKIRAMNSTFYSTLSNNGRCEVDHSSIFMPIKRYENPNNLTKQKLTTSL